MSNPRHAAFSTLLLVSGSGEFADRLIDRELTNGLLTGADRSLYPELVLGVLRQQGKLDYILGKFLDKPLAVLDQNSLIILRMALYQLACLDRIPDSAAVNESVELAKLFAPGKSGLINGVLRTYLRQSDAVRFPDSKEEPVAYIAARYSHPEWLVESWISQLGASEASLLAEFSSLRPHLTVRVNSLRTTREELLAVFAEQGIESAASRYSRESITITGRHSIYDLPGFTAGWFTIQDESSQLAGMLLGASSGDRVWDACAAPGGKSGHIAQLTGNNCELISTDISKIKGRSTCLDYL